MDENIANCCKCNTECCNMYCFHEKSTGCNSLMQNRRSGCQKLERQCLETCRPDILMKCLSFDNVIILSWHFLLFTNRTSRTTELLIVLPSCLNLSIGLSMGFTRGADGLYGIVMPFYQQPGFFCFLVFLKKGKSLFVMGSNSKLERYACRHHGISPLENKAKTKQKGKEGRFP